MTRTRVGGPSRARSIGGRSAGSSRPSRRAGRGGELSLAGPTVALYCQKSPAGAALTVAGCAHASLAPTDPFGDAHGEPAAAPSRADLDASTTGTDPSTAAGSVGRSVFLRGFFQRWDAHLLGLLAARRAQEALGKAGPGTHGDHRRAALAAGPLLRPGGGGRDLDAPVLHAQQCTSAVAPCQEVFSE
jgi:hypothetical protein